MDQVSVTEARSQLAELVSQVAYQGHRVILTRHGKPVAALVPVTELTVERAEPADRDVLELISRTRRADETRGRRIGQ